MNSLLKKISSILLLPFALFASENSDHPFDYDLHLTKIEGTGDTVMICLHGAGMSYKIIETLKNCSGQDYTWVGFNFPDHDLDHNYKAENSRFGSIDELLPVIHVLKTIIIDQKHEHVSLFGFSAGGGAIINTLAALNTTKYDAEIAKIGVTQSDKTRILEVLQKGEILLDTPLKSIRELIAFSGERKDLVILGERYRANSMEPIDSIEGLRGLALHIILHFQNPDEILSNRDDDLFFEKLQAVNELGTTQLVIGSKAGHQQPHLELWDYLQNK